MKVSIESLSMGVPLNTLVCGQAFVLLTSLCNGKQFVYIKTDHDAPTGFVDIVSLNTGITMLGDCKTSVIPIDVTVVPTRYDELSVTQGTIESTRPFETVLRETIEEKYNDIHDLVLHELEEPTESQRKADDIIIKIQEVICNGKTS